MQAIQSRVSDTNLQVVLIGTYEDTTSRSAEILTEVQGWLESIYFSECEAKLKTFQKGQRPFQISGKIQDLEKILKDRISPIKATFAVNTQSSSDCQKIISYIQGLCLLLLSLKFQKIVCLLVKFQPRI